MVISIARLEEIVSVLDGSRARGAGGKAALRFDDMSSLERMPTKLLSKQISAAPNAADFNNLQADVAAIHQCLSVLATLVKTRRR